MLESLDRRQLLAAGLAAAPLLLGGRGGLLPRGAPTAGRALVTADAESHVAVVSLSSMRVVQRLATVGDPRSIQSAGGGRAVVGHAGRGAISLLAGEPLRVRRVLRGFGTPRYTAVAPGGRLAYVSDSDHGEIAVVDLVAGRVLRRVEVGAGARHLGLHPDGRTLWVALGSSAAQIAVVGLRPDPERPLLLGHVRPPLHAHDVAFSPSGRRVWVTAGREPRIAVFGARSRVLVRVLGADAAPQHVCFGRGVAYIASGNGAAVATHALSDGHRRRNTRVPIGSYNVEQGRSRVVTPSLGTGALTVLDARGLRLAQVRVASAAHDACIV